MTVSSTKGTLWQEPLPVDRQQFVNIREGIVGDNSASVIPIRDFEGLFSEGGSIDSPKNAASGQNFRVHQPGLLTPRKGFRPADVDSSQTETSGEVIAAHGVHRPDADYFIFEDSGGNVRACKNPVE